MSEEYEKLENLINDMPNNQNKAMQRKSDSIENLRNTMNEKIKKLSDENSN